MNTERLEKIENRIKEIEDAGMKLRLAKEIGELKRERHQILLEDPEYRKEWEKGMKEAEEMVRISESFEAPKELNIENMELPSKEMLSKADDALKAGDIDEATRILLA